MFHYPKGIVSNYCYNNFISLITFLPLQLKLSERNEINSIKKMKLIYELMNWFPLNLMQWVIAVAILHQFINFSLFYLKQFILFPFVSGTEWRRRNELRNKLDCYISSSIQSARFSFIQWVSLTPKRIELKRKQCGQRGSGSEMYWRNEEWMEERNETNASRGHQRFASLHFFSFFHYIPEIK